MMEVEQKCQVCLLEVGVAVLAVSELVVAILRCPTPTYQRKWIVAAVVVVEVLMVEVMLMTVLHHPNPTCQRKLPENFVFASFDYSVVVVTAVLVEVLIGVFVFAAAAEVFVTVWVFRQHKIRGDLRLPRWRLLRQQRGRSAL